MAQRRNVHHLTVNALVYGPSGGGVRSVSFADASVLSVLSMFVSAVVMLYPCIVVSVDESLCINSDETSLREQCIGAKATVSLAFDFCFLSWIASWVDKQLFHPLRDSLDAPVHVYWRL